MDEQDKSSAGNDNGAAIFVAVVGWIIILLGIIFGIVFGPNQSNEYAYPATIIYWFVGLIIGTFFIGLAEVIRLLNKIAIRK
jgi:hypothetical protein